MSAETEIKGNVEVVELPQHDCSQYNQLMIPRVADPIAMLLMMPLILVNNLIMSITSIQRAMLTQQITNTGSGTFVKITYDDKGNITSIYERRF